MSFAVIGTFAGVAAGLATVAGLSYQIYSAANPPKTPQQATQALNKNQVQLGKLQAKMSTLQAQGKDTSAVQTAIGKVQNSIAFLNTWISQNGDTLAPKTPEGNFAGITDPLGSTTNTGAPQAASGGTSPLIIFGIVGAILAVGYLIYSTGKKK